MFNQVYWAIVSGESAVLDLRGIFRDDTGESPKFTFNVTYESQHGIDTVEELCDHLAVVQNDTLSCPPKKGRAYMTTTLFIHETIMPPVGIYPLLQG